jgi:glycosyltransferase involved in cell wall biosynthesis
VSAGPAAAVRTLHLIDTGGPGGAEMVFAQLVAAAERAGTNAGALVPYDGWLAGRLREHGVAPAFVPTRGSLSLGLLLRIVRAARARDATLLHAHLLGASVYAALAGALLGLPVLAVIHGATDLGGGGRFDGLKRWLLGRRRVQVIAVSDVVRDTLCAWGLAPTRVQVLTNGVDTEAFVPGRSRMLHAELALADDAIVVGAVGNIRTPKSYDVMLRAAARVCAADPRVHFAAAGDGDTAQFAPLLALRAELGLEGRFHFLGFRNAGAALYQGFDLFVSSARSEGLPLSFLEAMACGLPIAATASDGARSLLQATGAGELCPVGDDAALAALLLGLVAQPVRARALGEAGRTAVLAHYSLAATVARYAALERGMVAAR